MCAGVETCGGCVGACICSPAGLEPLRKDEASLSHPRGLGLWFPRWPPLDLFTLQVGQNLGKGTSSGGAAPCGLQEGSTGDLVEH